ncbi:MAG: hypothetical protein KA141_08050 [Rubrivivax sp.]|nr:hypothetical protein [Rubrivivax sp.]
MWTLDLLLAVTSLGLALALRPWRALGNAPLPWPALAWWAVLPLLWSLDAVSGMPVLQPLSGICILLLMLGWPLTVLMLLPVAAVMVLMADLSLAQALPRMVWLGLVPATLAMALGAGLRRWLPHHLFVYIFGRGFFATALAVTAAGALAAWLYGVPANLSLDDVMLARGLAAWGDAFLTGMLIAIFVAFKPEWLATYTDRLYLPDDRPPAP